MDRRAPGVGRVAQRSSTLDALDVDDVGAGRHADLDGLSELVAQLDQQRQAAIADGGALRGQAAVLDEAKPEAIPAVGGAIEQPAVGEHGARPMGRALGDADPPGKLADAELGNLGEGVDDVEGDADGLQRPAPIVHPSGGRLCAHGAACLELGAEADEDVLATVGGDELDTAGQAVGGPAEGQRQRRLAGGVEHAGEGAGPAGCVALLVGAERRPGLGRRRREQDVEAVAVGSPPPRRRLPRTARVGGRAR